MCQFTNPQLKGSLKEHYPKVNKANIDAYDFLPFSDLEKSVKDDVDFLKTHELIKKDIMISGWIYDTDTGKVSKSRWYLNLGFDGVFQINSV